jgi:GNAT superfamily N-acetyltransferase
MCQAGGHEQARAALLVKELGPATWPDFERIVEKHHGIWGGCWCVTFHLASRGSDRTVEQNRADKERLVRANRSPAALVYDGADSVGWCQFGPPAKLPARMSGYGKLDLALPDWRVTCFFVDRDRRRTGVAKAALAGALRMIASRDGGTVDGYPNDTRGRSTSGSFLWSGAVSMLAEAGFRPIGALGTSKRVMRAEVDRIALASADRP